MNFIRDYYSHADVRTRMVEFLGGASLDRATCMFISGDTTSPEENFMPRHPRELWKCLDHGFDVSRSLWDRDSLIADIDIEYVNFDFPAEPYLDPERTFDLQQPVEEAVERVLLEWGVCPLHLISGRGHHFLWKIRRDSRAFSRLGEFGPVPDFMTGFYDKPHRPSGAHVELDLAAAFGGLGMVIEYLAGRVREMAAPYSRVPIELTAVEVGPVDRGREIISIDVSEYGDPLNTRSVRIPFSVYMKPWHQRWLIGEDFVNRLPYMFLIPRHEMDIRESILTMRSAAKTIRLAGRASVDIPDGSAAMDRVIDTYLASFVAEYHQWFYSQEHDPPELWPQTYDQAPLDTMPPCVRHLLVHPNDLLVKPAGIQQVVRVLLAAGWHPRHIAGLIRSKYERDYGWGYRWYEFSAGQRADFYVRLFGGLIFAGQDDLLDFNCQSTKEKQFCFWFGHCCNLEQYRDLLLQRREDERLAGRVLDGLFLRDEHT